MGTLTTQLYIHVHVVAYTMYNCFLAILVVVTKALIVFAELGTLKSELSVYTV